LLPIPLEIEPATVEANGTVLSFMLVLPLPDAFVAGQLSATVRLRPTGKPADVETNAIPLVIAPVPILAGAGAATAIRSAGTNVVTVTLQSSPPARPKQRATLILGALEAQAEPRAVVTDPLRFIFPASLADGTYAVRLRIDGTESRLVDRSGPTPAFDPNQVLKVPQP
jgi:hypothetical protein